MPDDDFPKPTLRSTDFAAWFESEQTEHATENYVNIRLRARNASQLQDLRPTFARYLEWAHADARRIFMDGFSMSLDPRGGAMTTAYPRDLPLKTRKGYFGEAFCGMLAESQQIHRKEGWVVPIFLFRLHTQAEEYLMRLITGEQAAAVIAGRTGSDCLALSLHPDGKVKAMLGAEAKCHESFNISIARTALADLGAQAAVPVSLGQLKRLLAEIGPEQFEATILDLEEIIRNARKSTVPRHDLLVLIFEDPSIKTYDSPRISAQDKIDLYRANRPVQVVEVHLPGAEMLIEELYTASYMRN